jgi:predicted dehydrogenase
MSPIRVALVGLSASAKVSWAAEAHLPYLLSPLGRSHYTITTLLNSSIAAAESARTHFGLPASIKCYGDPNLLAQDPDIDLVVVNTRVDTHVAIALPSILAGKAVYIEWPIASSSTSAKELLSASPDSLSNSIAGFQGRTSPIVLILKHLLRSGVIGKILNSEIHAFGNLLPRDKLPEGLAYFADRKVGGNPITIAYSHMIDFIHEVLGEWVPGTMKGRMQIQRPSIAIINAAGETISTIISDVPDLLTVHGSLAPGTQKQGIEAVKDATLAVWYRSGQPFKGTPAFQWHINGEKGEIRITSPSGLYLHSDSFAEPFKVEIHDHATDEIREEAWAWKEWQEDLPAKARIGGELYERFARWVEGGRKEMSLLGDEEVWPTVGDAVKRHEELEELFRQFDAQTL